MSAGNVMHFCKAQGILNKDYKSWMMAQTKRIIEHADQYAKDNCGHGVIHIPTWRTRKETLAHERQQQEHLTSGLIGVWSSWKRVHPIVPDIVRQQGVHSYRIIRPDVTTCTITLMTLSFAS